MTVRLSIGRGVLGHTIYPVELTTGGYCTLCRPYPGAHGYDVELAKEGLASMS